MSVSNYNWKYLVVLVAVLSAMLIGSPSDAQTKTPKTPQDYNAKCDGIEDDTDELQAWLLAGLTNPLIMTEGVCVFTRPMSLPIPLPSLSIIGTGKYKSILLYKPAENTPNSDTADLITFGKSGEGAAQPAEFASYGANLKDFAIVSDEKMLGGFGLKLTNFRYSQVDIRLGSPNNPTIIDKNPVLSTNIVGNHNLFGGIWFNQAYFITMNSTLIASQGGDAIRVNDGVELRLGHTVLDGDFTNKSGTGIHVAGGFGGLLTESVDEIHYEVGLLVDNQMSQTSNNQIFVSPESVFDSNSLAGCHLNQTVDGVSLIVFLDGWFATSGGYGCLIESWPGVVMSSQGKFYNTQSTRGRGDGLYFSGVRPATVILGGGVLIASNSGYNIASKHPINIWGGVVPFPNQGSNVSLSNVGLCTSNAPPAC